MAVYEKEIKDEDGKLNYDRVEDIVRRYQSDVMSQNKDGGPHCRGEADPPVHQQSHTDQQGHVPEGGFRWGL